MPRQTRSKRKAPDAAERRHEQRAHILDVADAVIRRDGARASVNRIAAEAQVGKPIIYRRFGDKDGLYQALAQRYVELLMDRLRASLTTGEDPRARLFATIDAYLAFVEEHSAEYGFLMHRATREAPNTRDTVTDFIQQVAAEVATELGEELRRAGVDSGPTEPWAHGIVGMVQLAGDWWLQSRTMPRSRLASYLTDLLWKGFVGAMEQTQAGG